MALNGWGVFLLTLIIYWWVYFAVLVVGIFLLFSSHKFLKITGIFFILVPICCYLIMFLFLIFASRFSVG